MDKLMAANPIDFSIHSEDEFGKTYKFPKKFITIRGKQKTLTEDQKKALSERMKKDTESKTI